MRCLGGGEEGRGGGERRRGGEGGEKEGRGRDGATRDVGRKRRNVSAWGCQREPLSAREACCLLDSVVLICKMETLMPTLPDYWEGRCIRGSAG